MVRRAKTFRGFAVASVVIAILIAACDAPAPTPVDTVTPYPTFTPYSTYTSPPPTPTSSPTPEPTPTRAPTPIALTAAQVLAMTRERMEGVATLRAEMNGRAEQGDVSVIFILGAGMDLPNKAHGTLEAGGEQYEFLRLADLDYVATYGQSFGEDYYSESGAVFLDILKPLLEPGNEEPFTELERQPDETIDGQAFYRVALRVDMKEFMESLTQEALPGVEVRGRGELLIDRKSLLPHSFNVSCQSCFFAFVSDMNLVLDFTLSGFNQPVHIPSPTDRPTLLSDPCAPSSADGITEPGSSPETALPVAVGNTVSGDLPSGQCRDLFSFQAQAGQTYLIETQLRTLGDSELYLYGTDGTTTLAYNDDYFGLESRILWAASSDGTYYVAVGDLDSIGGTYNLTIRLAQPGEEAPIATATAVPTATAFAPMATSTPYPAPTPTTTP